MSPLHDAAVINDVETINRLLDGGADVNQRNYYDRTPLYLAMVYRQLEAVKTLINRGANVNDKNNGWTALHYAACNQQEDMVKLLLGAGADVTIKIGIGKTAADLASTPEIRKLIEEYTLEDIKEPGCD